VKKLLVLLVLVFPLVAGLACGKGGEAAAPQVEPTDEPDLVDTLMGAHSKATRVACFITMGTEGTDDLTSVCQELVPEWEAASGLCKLRLVQGKTCDE